MSPPRPRWHRSIQGRLVALFLLLALGTSVVFLLGMQRVLKGGWESWAQPLVADYIDRLVQEIGSPPAAERAQALASRLPIRLRIDGPVLQWDSHPQRRSHGRGPGSDDDHDNDNDNVGGSDRRGDSAREWGLLRYSADGHRLRFGLAAPQGHARARWLGWATLGGLLLLTAMAWAAVRRQLAPLADISIGVEAYGRGEFARAIVVRRPDELGALAMRINGMANRLSAMLEAKRSLLLAISHELRSPLTRARLNAELLAHSPERQALLQDLGEMRELITSLLESERLAQPHAVLHSTPTELPALVRELVATGFAGRGVVLDLQPPGLDVAVDATRIRLLLRNLLDNALRHSPAGAPPPLVFLRREADGRLALGVRDHGPGVAPEHLPLLAQAFYRPDDARTREAGGVGLGLYLCRLVAQAHGGELRLRNADPGLEVVMIWPG